MRVLEYPFNSGEIISKKRKIKRELLKDGRTRTRKRIAVLGGYTTNDIISILELFLLNYGFEPEFYESEYGQYYQDAMFFNEKLEQFHPDIIYICTCNRNISKYPEINDDEEKISNLLETEFFQYSTIWGRIASTYHCPIIQNNFEMPMYRLLGNKDASDIHGAVNFLTRLNMKFYEYSQTHDNFFICDINYISADYGLKEWCDPFFWYMYKYALNVNAIPSLAFNVANVIKSIFGKNKKGFVLDLDNTLWGGVIGDEGIENIKMGSEEAIGQAFSEFQEYILAHKQLGVMLNVASKNDETNALAGLNHPDSKIKPADFIEIKANWESKDRNFEQIAEDLNVLPESLVFIDDNPAERHIITEQLAGVSAPDIGEVHQYIHNIDRNGFFEMTIFSNDDIKRNEMYKENVQRLRLKASFADYGEYLKSLEMKAEIKPFEPLYFGRIAQLTNKSNQFNLTTKRYTQSEIEEVAYNKKTITMCGKLKDRFGDNGVVSIIIGRIDRTICHIDLWLMSCRVLKRDMECAMMDELVEVCKEQNITTIIGYYYPTTKNKMVKNFYQDFGFKKINENVTGDSIWEYKLPTENVKFNLYIQIVDRG